MDEILKILREEEMASCSQGSRMEVVNGRKNQRPNSNVKLCYICRQPNHLSKDCFYLNNKSKTDVPNQEKTKELF